MKILVGTNLAVRFALELSALAAAGYWGWTSGGGVLRWLLVIAAPALVAAVWALFVSPKPVLALARPLRLAIEFAVFGAAAAGLAATGHWTLAVVFGAVALVSGTLNYLWTGTSSMSDGGGGI